MFLLHSTNIHPQTFATKRVPSFLMGDFGIVPNSLFYSTGENYAVENCSIFFCTSKYGLGTSWQEAIAAFMGTL